MSITKFSYAKTPYLLQQIAHINQLRIELHLSALSLNDKSAYRWTGLTNRVLYAFELMGKPLDISFIQDCFRTPVDARVSPVQAEVMRFKRAHDFILQNWLANTRSVRVEDLRELYTMATAESMKKSNDQETEHDLRYIQTNPDNPVIQAALVSMFIQTNSTFGKSPLMHFLTPLLFLYKNGYDMRRMIVPEQYFATHKDRYHTIMLQCMKDNNLTPWLEFYADAVEYQLGRLLKDIQNSGDTGSDTNMLLLNARQKLIISSLDEPDSKISNREVQNRFKVSAITAARDLTQLAQLDLVIPIGRGRSTYYMKK